MSCPYLFEIKRGCRLNPKVARLRLRNFKCQNPRKKRARVSNPSQVEDWKIRQGESYETVFRDKVLNGPSLSMGVKGGDKFHNKECCYSICSNATSHVHLVGDDEVKFGNYVKSAPW